jgi:YbgC/YbaW family acyl-CoA thioester hydrolase
MSISNEYEISTRGYELDSFGHVNNSVYLNYLEEGRWRLLNEHELLDTFLNQELFLVVIEMNIKYIREIRMFDKLKVTTTAHLEGSCVICSQKILNKETDRAAAKAICKLFPVNNSRLPCDLPTKLKDAFSREINTKFVHS